MRKILILTYFLIIVFTLNSKAQDFWELVNIPDSIELKDFTIDTNGIVFFGSNLGVYKSEDNGEIWEYCNFNKITTDLVIAPDNSVYIIGINTPNAALYRSTDIGITWEMVNPGHLPVVGLFTTSSYLMFYTTGGGIFKSADSGYTWTQVLSTVNTEVFNDIIEKDSFLFAGSTHFMSSAGGGVYRSSDIGDTWEHVAFSGSGIYSFAIDQSNNLLAGIGFVYSGWSFGVWRSIDNGINWNRLLYKIIMSLEVDDFGGIYAGCGIYTKKLDYHPVYYSADNGQTWDSLDSGMHADSEVNSIKISPSDYVYAVTSSPNHLYRSVYPIVSMSEKSREKLDIKVFPNPFNEELFVQINNIENGENDIYIQFYNVSGIKITEGKIYNSIAASNQIKIDTDFIKPGMYLMKIIIGQENYSIKIFKK